jgi:hypothetical protein
VLKKKENSISLGSFVSTPCVKMASFLNLLPRSVAGEIRERGQAVIYQQPAGPILSSHLRRQLEKSGLIITAGASTDSRPAPP